MFNRSGVHLDHDLPGSCGAMVFNDFRTFLDLFGDPPKGAPLGGYLDKSCNHEAEFLWVDIGKIASNDSRSLHSPETVGDCRNRHIYSSPQISVGKPSVSLEVGQ